MECQNKKEMAAMNRLIGKLLFLCAACMFGVSSWAATIASITYTVENLADVGTGDLWRYRYMVNGSFEQFSGFEVNFDGSLYTLLQDPPPPVAQWATSTIPPAGPGSPGLYIALAGIDFPSLAGEFTVDFVWLGAPQTTPGSQLIDVIFPDATFELAGSTIPRGNTPAPEPASLALLAGGLLLLRQMRKTVAPT
jgi:hypothetical protein